VLRNISGPANLKTKRYNAAQPLRSQNREEIERRPGNQPYDFLTYSSTHFSTNSSQPAKLNKLDDLQSAAISEMTHEGMVLWQGPDESKEEPLAISLFEPSVESDKMSDLGGLDQILEAQSSLFPGETQSDEEAVENMLTG
jgi:hypothetical protein